MHGSSKYDVKQTPYGKGGSFEAAGEMIVLGTCTCGVDKRDLIPCEHMAALVVGSRIPDIT